MKLDKFELNKKLHQGLIAVDELIAKYGIEEDDRLTRDCIDQRRQLFAEYEQTLVNLVSADSANNHIVKNLYRPDPELGEFVDLWCGQIRNLEFRPIYLSDIEYCQRFIDCYLPKSWNWDTDFVMLINPFDESLLRELLGRGQKNVIIFRTKTSKSFDKSFRDRFNEFWEISSLEELEQALRFYPIKVSNICHLDCMGHSEADIDSEKINKIIKEGIYVRQINMNTIGKHSIKWATNTIKNIPNILKNKNITSVSLLNAKTGVIVSPGPSLEKNVHLLKDYADRLFIICPIRAVPILRSHGVEPDFVFQLDAVGGGFLENSKSAIKEPVKNLIVDATVDPGFFDFPAEKTFWYFSQSKTLGLEEYCDVGKFGLDAVSVSITCLKFAYNSGLTNLVLLGQDLAFTEAKRYSDGGELDFNTALSSVPDILVDGYYGGKVGTSADYDFFIGQFAELGQLMGDAGCKMFNCTEGGAFIDNFEHVSLAHFLSDNNFKGKKSVTEKKDAVREFSDVVKFCRKSTEQILKVESFGKRALEIEKKEELSVDDIKNRDKYLRKMIKFSDQNKILWWAFQDTLLNVEQLTYRKENVSDLTSFLEEILETTVSMKENLIQTELTLIAELNSKSATS